MFPSPDFDKSACRGRWGCMCLRVQCYKLNFVSISSIKRTLASGLGEEGGEGKTGVQRKSSKGVVMS